jgi:hypothetical protein
MILLEVKCENRTLQRIIVTVMYANNVIKELEFHIFRTHEKLLLPHPPKTVHL